MKDGTPPLHSTSSTPPHAYTRPRMHTQKCHFVSICEEKNQKSCGAPSPAALRGLGYTSRFANKIKSRCRCLYCSYLHTYLLPHLSAPFLIPAIPFINCSSPSPRSSSFLPHLFSASPSSLNFFHLHHLRRSSSDHCSNLP